jgi:hypothetical protein
MPARGASACYRDGHLDLFVSRGHGVAGWAEVQHNLLYRNNGDGTLANLNAAAVGSIVNSGGASNGSAWADYDNDGWPDLFVANYAGRKPCALNGLRAPCRNSKMCLQGRF